MARKEDRRVAILTDADQVADACWHHLEDTASRMGRAVVRKAFSAVPRTRWRRHREVEMEIMDDKSSSRRCSGVTLALAFEAGRLLSDRRADDFMLATGDPGLAGLVEKIAASGVRVHVAVPINAANAVPALVRTADTLFVLTPRDRDRLAGRCALSVASADSVMKALASLDFGHDEPVGDVESVSDTLERVLSEPIAVVDDGG